MELQESFLKDLFSFIKWNLLPLFYIENKHSLIDTKFVFFLS